MTESKTPRAPRCSQRHRIFSRRVEVLRCLDDGMSIKAMAAELGFTDIPMPSIYRNVSALRDKYRIQTETPAPGRDDAAMRGEAAQAREAPSAAPVATTATGPKPARRRRKFVHARSDDGRPKRSYDPSTWKHDI